MKPLLAGLVVVCTSLPFLHAQTMSHEEEIVRNTYARVSFLCAVGVLADSVAFNRSGHEFSHPEIDRKMAAAIPTYDLSNFEVGDLSTIKDRKFGDFVSLPADGQRVIRIRGMGISYAEPPNMPSGPVFQWDELRVQWTNPETGPWPDPRGLMSALQTGAIQEYTAPGLPTAPLQTVTYTRYAAFTVNATFQGESTGPYKAMFIFGTYGHGKTTTIPYDLISGEYSGLGHSFRAGGYPEGFLRTSLRENPEISSWLRANEMPASSCGSATVELCCSHGRCGISQADLNRDLAAPLPSPTLEATAARGASDAVRETPPPACQVTSRVGDVNAILIDTDGSGFHLTSAAEGLHWDFYANHHPIHLAWTASGSTTGWLAMPDKNGRVASARQMFSNVAPQAGAKDGELNGFSALVMYDTNGDGVIDAKDDPWWAKFRVWIDSNHDGISQPQELHSMDEFGITAISLKCTELQATDSFKNEFGLKGRITLKDGSKRSIYDVNLDTIPVPWSQAQTK